MKAAVVDTNVLVVANGRAAQAGPGCVANCVETLTQVQATGRIVLDDRLLILSEYLANASLSGQPGLGDAFLKWVWEHQAVAECCETVAVKPRDGSFEEFPDTPELEGFDPSDRKFVAVAIASKNNPEVLNAVDSDWWDFRDVLTRNGVHVRFLCPEQFKRRRR
jgi:hypothetical protein